jgi:aspartate aminotransferase
VDVRALVDAGFNAREFVLFCAREGRVEVNGKAYTLLVSPMAGFYSVSAGQPNPGKTQMRIAYVEPSEKMEMVPGLFTELFKKYTASSR